MIRPIKHDKASKHKKGKAFKSNVSVHPFMMVAIVAALATVIFLIAVYFFGYLK